MLHDMHAHTVVGVVGKSVVALGGDGLNGCTYTDAQLCVSDNRVDELCKLGDDAVHLPLAII